MKGQRVEGWVEGPWRQEACLSITFAILVLQLSRISFSAKKLGSIC